ncbi:unnamed protein product [Prorocentrum cordatum]|uniref:Uncharacterized protein n=1 Tax=Prorocentrum cordatum TaxID=2364126 RepID=A0ABN9Q0S9_9DINO|nr:unnamed protein product [Polarella glacialis]
MKGAPEGPDGTPFPYTGLCWAWSPTAAALFSRPISRTRGLGWQGGTRERAPPGLEGAARSSALVPGEAGSTSLVRERWREEVRVSPGWEGHTLSPTSSRQRDRWADGRASALRRP